VNARGLSYLDHSKNTVRRCLLVLARVFHAATQCNTLQHYAIHCNTVQNQYRDRRDDRGRYLLMLARVVHTATHCYTLQHTATRCNTMQHTAAHCKTLQHQYQDRRDDRGRRCLLELVQVPQGMQPLCPVHIAVCCSVWQFVAVCYIVLQCEAVCCSVQCAAGHVATVPCSCCSVLQCVAASCSVLQSLMTQNTQKKPEVVYLRYGTLVRQMISGRSRIHT